MCIGWEGVWVKYKFCLEKKQMLRRGVCEGGRGQRREGRGG